VIDAPAPAISLGQVTTGTAQTTTKNNVRAVKKRRQADRNRHASRLLQGGGLELISESVELDSANQIVHTRVYKESTAPVLRAEQV
jgi:hypothetical protein